MSDIQGARTDEEASGQAGQGEGVDLRTEVPHSARMYDYYLGGKDNFASDREAAAEMLRAHPDVAESARANRRFLSRAVRYLAEQGVRQFLDIGTGIPTANNTHQVAQSVAPDARVAYVDNDPIVLSHARALLSGTSDGRTGYVNADLRDAEAILDAPEFRDVIEREQPVALLLIAILHFFDDADEPYQIVSRLLDALPSGSYLVISQVTADFLSYDVQKSRGMEIYQNSGITVRPRTYEEFGRFFEGTELVDPGIVPGPEWRPELPEDCQMTREQALGYAAVGRKP